MRSLIRSARLSNASRSIANFSNSFVRSLFASSFPPLTPYLNLNLLRSLVRCPKFPTRCLIFPRLPLLSDLTAHCCRFDVLCFFNSLYFRSNFVRSVFAAILLESLEILLILQRVLLFAQFFSFLVHAFDFMGHFNARSRSVAVATKLSTSFCPRWLFRVLLKCCYAEIKFLFIYH